VTRWATATARRDYAAASPITRARARRRSYGPRLREFERENRELKMENDFLKKAAAYFAPQPSVTDKFGFIDAEYAAYREAGDTGVTSTVKMCRWMEVSRSGFYE
jgi:hypothetical protein